MTNILKFPALTSPNSDKEVNKLLKLLKKMEQKEEESSRATLDYFEKLMKFVEYEDLLSKKEKKDLIKRQKKYYYEKLMKDFETILNT